MGLGTKRICGTCGAKFYDLEKTPVICPKCGTAFDVESHNKHKRSRKKAEKEVVEEVEIGGIGEIEALEEIEEDDTAVIAELDDEIRDEMAVEDSEAVIADTDSDKMLVDLEDDTEILEGGDDESSEQK